MSARRLLETYWDAALPVRPIAIADAMGVKVYRQSEMNETAIIERLPGRSHRVVVNANEPLLRMRFAVAHAIGHVVMGHLGPGGTHSDSLDHFHSDVRSPIERAANEFALELLIPEDALDVVLRKSNRMAEIATLFCVSEVALSIRMKNLGILPSARHALKMG